MVSACCVAGCGSAPSAPVKAPAAPVRWEGSGLRVSLSEVAKSVCVSEQGCATGPKGAVSIKPLEPKLKQAISDALVTAAGGKLTDTYGDAIDYRAESLSNSRGLIASNGRVHDALVRGFESLR